MREKPTQQPGTLAITIDLEPESIHTSTVSAAALNRVTDWLFETFSNHAVPATWAVTDPVHSAASEQISAQLPNHEIAVLGDASWVGAQAGRSRFAQELSRRFLGARAVGIPATSLVPRVAVDADHLDLLAKLGVHAISEPTRTRRRAAAPEAIRYGVWKIGVGHTIGEQSAWNLRDSLALRYQIRTAAKQGAHYHLMISAARLSECGAKTLRSIERVLHLAERLSEKHRLRVETLSEIAQRLSDIPKTSPARSILRAAG